MDSVTDQNLLPADIALLRNLVDEKFHTDSSTLALLKELEAEPTVCTTYDVTQLNTKDGIKGTLLAAYMRWATTIVRNPVDVVFLTHILLYLTTSVPSAITLYCRYTWQHAILHGVMQVYYSGPFTLMLHNHIHNNGVLQKRYALFDQLWPLILEPLMGHTWHSYYYHHVKHHHTENNGPEDLSSTIRYQRDELGQFLIYLNRFIFCIWIELPWYFVRKRSYYRAMVVAFCEIGSYTFIALLAQWKFWPTLSVFIIPLAIMRLGMMIGNWGQHALVDEHDPLSDFRTSITLIDEASNRHCFNDGYHTSHHLNPLRHWKDHPRAFLASKHTYATNQALVFKDIDYLMVTYRLLRKDYASLANHMVPIGDEQKAMSQKEKADMLRTKTRRFTEQDIINKFYGGKAPESNKHDHFLLAWKYLVKRISCVIDGSYTKL